MQNNTTTTNKTDDMNREVSYGGFQYRHDYDEYKKEQAEKQQDKRTRSVIIAVIAVAFVILLGLVAVFAADTIMRTRGYTFRDFLHGTRPASLVPHKTELDEAAADKLISGSTVAVKRGGSSAGSGVIITEDGYILTGCGAAENSGVLTVMTQDGQETEARLIGADSNKGICLIKIEKSGLKPAEIGDSRALGEGQRVYCKSAGDPVASLTVISSDDELRIVLEGDTVSGAIVLNTYGQVVGITDGSGDENVTAVHMDAVLEPIKKLMTSSSKNDVTVSETPSAIEKLGVRVETVTEKHARIYSIPVGCYVISADEGSKLRKDDIIVSANGKEISDAESLSKALQGSDGYELRIYRNGSYTDIKSE